MASPIIDEGARKLALIDSRFLASFEAKPSYSRATAEEISVAEPVVLYEKRSDHIAIITMNRPERMNALNPEGAELLREAEEDFRNDDDMWVGIITGRGRAFSVGRDLKKTAEESDAGLGIRPPSRRPRSADPETWKPLIAAINGYALGGGLARALRCDLRIAADTALLGMPETRWNLMAGFAPSLLGEIPKTLLLEMLFTAKPITAARAYEAGLINQVVSQEELVPAAIAMAQSICENSPLAVRAAKEMIHRAVGHPPGIVAPLVHHIYERLVTAEDAAEGPRSFAEKRPAQWKGR
jgi:enoyl-CoA hydratase/carnithine racemase